MIQPQNYFFGIIQTQPDSSSTLNDMDELCLSLKRELLLQPWAFQGVPGCPLVFLSSKTPHKMHQGRLVYDH